MDISINDTRQTGAVRNRTYRGRTGLFIFRIHHKSPNPLNPPTPLTRGEDKRGSGGLMSQLRKF